MNPNSCSLNTSSCTLFLSLSSSSFPIFLDLSSCWLYLPFILPLFFLSSYVTLSWIYGYTCPIKHLSCHFSIIKVDFCGVFIVQASHLSFNEANIRQQHLINAEVTIMLDSMQYSACYSGMETEVASLVNLLISSWLGYHISG